MKIRIKKRMLSVMILLTALVMAVPVSSETVFADNKEEKTIKVGWYAFKGMIDQDESGNYSGYAVDYLDEMSKYTNWNYECEYDTWENLLKKLADGEIDLLCSAQYTEARDEVFDYATVPLGYETTVLYVRQDDDRYYYEDFETFDGMKVAALKENYHNSVFEQYAVEHDFDYSLVFYDSYDEAFEALDNGEVDAALTGSMSMRSEYKQVAEFSPEPFYITVTEGNTELLDEVNSTMETIRIKKPNFLDTLYQKYYGAQYDDTAPSFTREEAEYIASVGTIKVGNQVGRFPFCEEDSDGNLYGIQVDLLDKISEMSGLQFENEVVEDGVRAVDYMQEDGVRIFNGLPQSEFATFSPDITLSEPMFSDSITFVARRGSDLNVDDAIHIVIPAGYVNGEQVLSASYPNAAVSFCDTKEDCLNALVDGNADFALLDTYMCNAMLQKPYYESLVTLDAYEEEQNLVIATLNTEDERLMSIINKCLVRIGMNTRNNLITKYTVTSQYQLTFSDYLYKYRSLFIVIGILILCLLVALVVVIAIRTRSSSKIKAANMQLAELNQILEATNCELEESNEKLEESYEELESTNDELGQTNAQLEVAVEKANAASVAKSQFLAQMSHEIRTPMNAIIGLTNIARNNISDANKTADSLLKIDGASKLLLGIINDVLDMSAIESNKMKLASMEFDFKQLLESITSVFYQQCKQKDIRYEMRMKGVTEEVLVGDSLRVNQILMNLLSNAVKFTPAGGEIDVMVIQASSSKETAQMRFIVSDTGCGMSEDLQKRLFNPFEQEDATTARKHGGSGLGLAITKNLVQMMNGIISVNSKLGEGTVFTVDIPFGIVKSQIPIDDRTFTDIRALIIDDDKDSCEYAGLLMERLGVEYDYVISGEEALERMGEAEDQGKPYNICIVDWKMPKMDGIEVTENIKKIFGKEAVVIIASAYDLEEVAEEGKTSGADYFIPKPLFQSTFFNIFSKISKVGYHKVPIGEKSLDEKSFSGKKALIAEDVELNMEVAIELLKVVGIKSVCAEDGAIAVDIFKRSKPNEFDIIFLDINMPNMDGYQAAKEIRRLERVDAKTMPIYAMTANAFAEDIAAALDAGMNGHIAKPIEPDVLYKTLRSVFEEETE